MTPLPADHVTAALARIAANPTPAAVYEEAATLNLNVAAIVAGAAVIRTRRERARAVRPGPAEIMLADIRSAGW